LTYPIKGLLRHTRHGIRHGRRHHRQGPSARTRRSVAPLIDGLAFAGFIADKAFDSNSIIADINERGAKIVISQHPRRAAPLPIEAEIYKWHHLIENFFCKPKEFKRIAMRADKTDQSFAANNNSGYDEPS
jgi:transposase